MARSWLLQYPPGMLAEGRTIKRFTSQDAFNGYVKALRGFGYGVHFSTPNTAAVSVPVPRGTE